MNWIGLYMLSLVLKQKRPLIIGETLREEIGGALQEMLGLVSRPTIVSKEYVKGAHVPTESYELSPISNRILIEIVGQPESATVTTYEVDEPSLPDDEQGAFVSVSPATMRTPLEAALAASVALVFGRELGSEIGDPPTFYTSRLNQSPDSFIKAVKISGTFDDYRVAADEFYGKLPVSSD